MASYDSDSSGAEDDGYTETNVLLGYASKEPTDDTTSQLGGQPTWLDDKLPPSGALAKCKVCNNFLTLLLQLNGDLPERFPGHERRLYLFGCRRKTCRRKEGSIRGFRAVRSGSVAPPKTQQPVKAQQVEEDISVPDEPAQKQQSNIGASLFGVNPSSASSSSNPFSTGASSSASANPFASSSSPLNPFAGTSSLAAKPPQPPQQPEKLITSTASLPETFASKARISSPEPTLPPRPSGPAEPWPIQSALPPAYPHYHLDADYEVLDTPKHSIPSQARIDMDIDESSTTTTSTNSTSIADDNKANFESAMDTTFQKFADRMAQNPEQVLRYEFSGQPILYSKTDAVGKKLGAGVEAAKVQISAGKSGMPKCANCGAERVFELQLTPHAIVELEAEELGLEGMEWGTIIMGVCSKDCVARGIKAGEVGYVEEYAGVQWEEQVSRK